MHNLNESSDFLFYNGGDGNIRIEVIIGDETVWLDQKSMAQVFDVEVPAISKHISNIYEEGELERDSTLSKMEIVQKEGKRDVNRSIEFYNLDMIIAVGYRVNSYSATKFRIWATSILKEYLIKGFALDDDRLKQGKNLFNKDYFTELLERIREIRASERLFYQKVTDLYATSVDYDKNSPITKKFYATVQNKLHWAIHHHTAAELIKLRANSTSPNMGLTSWKNSKSGGKIIKTDVSVAKNYLSKEELQGLNILVTMYLDYAENLVKRKIVLKMEDWSNRLDLFLQFNEYDILNNAGELSHEVATKLAEQEYTKFRVIQDKEYVSDFDKTIEEIKTSGKLPKGVIKPISIKPVSDFNKKLKKALNHNPKKNDKS